MRCRKNVKSMTSQEKADFVRAIVVLKDQPSILHPGLQGRYDDFVEVHREAMGTAIIQNGNLIDPGWAHFDSAFFPWHRELIYQFEEELCALVAGVTVPYWDWTRDQQPADAGWPFTHDFIGTDGTQSINFQDDSSKNNQVLRETVNAAATPYPYEFDPETWVLAVLDSGDTRHWSGLTRNFADEYSVVDAQLLPANDIAVPGTNGSFRDAINSSTYLGLRARSEDIHNIVHRWVGGIVPLDLNNNGQIGQDEIFNGDMMSSSSPNDPVFWLHHAAIDRMWSIWRDKNSGQAEEFYYEHLNGFQGHGIDDNLIYHAPGATNPFLASTSPRQLINGHAQHGTSIWYESDLPEIILDSGVMLNFGSVPQGLTEHQAIHFRVALCRPMIFRIVDAPTGDFGTPSGLSFPVVPDLTANYVDVYIQLSYQANGGMQSSEVELEAYIIDEEGYYAANENDEYLLEKYTIDLEGSTAITLEEHNGSVMAMTRPRAVLETHSWSPVKPSKEEITKRFQANVKIEK